MLSVPSTYKYIYMYILHCTSRLSNTDSGDIWWSGDPFDLKLLRQRQQLQQKANQSALVFNSTRKVSFFFLCVAHDAVICCPSFCSSCWLQATMQVRALPQLLYWHKLCVVSHDEFQMVMTTWSAAWAGSKFLAVIACAFAVPSFLVLWTCFLRLFASNCHGSLVLFLWLVL